MCGVIFQQSPDLLLTEDIRVPAWVHDRLSFLDWTASDQFPEHGRIDYLQGEIWIDMSQEQLFSHNQVRAQFYVVLGTLIDEVHKGDFFAAGVRLSHPQADWSNVPDAIFIASATYARGRVRLIEGEKHGYNEIEGSPDMVLEVVSDSSVRKDKVLGRDLYWKAGIREYWLVDAREEPLSFDILRHTTRGYSASRKTDGWIKSAVFGKSFRLTQEADALGYPSYTLGIR